MNARYLAVRRTLLQGIARCRLQLAHANKTQDAALKSRAMTTWNLCRSGLKKYPAPHTPYQLDLFPETLQTGYTERPE